MKRPQHEGPAQKATAGIPEPVGQLTGLPVQRVCTEIISAGVAPSVAADRRVRRRSGTDPATLIALRRSVPAVIRRSITIANPSVTFMGGPRSLEDVEKSLSGKALARFRELDDDMLDHPFDTFGDLLAECRKAEVGSPMFVFGASSTPLLTPVPALKSPTRHEYAASNTAAPDFWDVPQTPYHDGSVRLPARVQAAPAMSQLLDDTKQQRYLPERKVDTSEKTNVFQYQLQLTCRRTLIEPADGKWVDTADLPQVALSVKSPLYQSKGDKLPVGRTEAERERHKPFNKEKLGTEIRSGLVDTRSYAAQHHQYDPNAIRAHDLRKGKLDPAEFSAKNESGWKFSNQQIGTAFFHSETQAYGMARTDMPPMITDLLNQVRNLAAEGKPIRVVFNSLHIIGASYPNTVCNNACKPTLANLRKLITAEFDKQITSKSGEYEPKGLLIRPSQYFRAHFSVTAEREFKGYQAGAIVVELDPSTLPEHHVTEFPPRQRKPATTTSTKRRKHPTKEKGTTQKKRKIEKD